MQHRFQRFQHFTRLHNSLPAIRQKHQRGFTLIEILVSIIILSFGLLGMVGIQALALKSNADAKLQSSAVRMGKELAEMMRGNKNVALSQLASNPYLGDWVAPAAPPAAVACFSDGAALCTSPLLVASWEISDWVARVQAEFPGARVQVCLDEQPYDASGLPQWGCTISSTKKDRIAIKIGWIRETTNKTRVKTANAAADRTVNNNVAFDNAVSRPTVIYNVTPGSLD